MTTHFQFATIELMPYPELGEFVIVGVLAISDKNRMAALTCVAEKDGRLAKFFPEIDPKVFASALETVSTSFRELNKQRGSKEAKELFQTLTSKREGMIRFTPRGAGTAEDLDQWVNDTYERIVLRNQPQPSGQSERGPKPKARAPKS